MEQPWTILKLLEWTTSYFKTAGIESPRIDAEVLIAHSLSLQRIDLYTKFDQPLEKQELDNFKPLLKRRKNGEPVAYIIGQREFWSLDFKVCPDVLIPRPDTEILVEQAIKAIDRKTASAPNLRIADIGTGSGAVITSLAKERPDHTCFASDIHLPTLQCARDNMELNNVEPALFQADLLSCIRPATLDIIVSNPPYIKTSDMATLQREVSFEPTRALDGGADGLIFIEKIIQSAATALKPDGTLLMEIGFGQMDDTRTLAEATGCFNTIEFFKDYSGIHRVVVMDRV